MTAIPEEIIVPNPKWKNATYEYAIIRIGPNAVLKLSRVPEHCVPVRGNEIVNGEIVPIPPFITLKELHDQASEK